MTVVQHQADYRQCGRQQIVQRTWQARRCTPPGHLNFLEIKDKLFGIVCLSWDVQMDTAATRSLKADGFLLGCLPYEEHFGSRSRKRMKTRIYTFLIACPFRLFRILQAFTFLSLVFYFSPGVCMLSCRYALAQVHVQFARFDSVKFVMVHFLTMVL